MESEKNEMARAFSFNSGLSKQVFSKALEEGRKEIAKTEKIYTEICPAMVRDANKELYLKHKKAKNTLKKLNATEYEITSGFNHINFKTDKNIQVIDAEYTFIARYSMIKEFYIWEWGYHVKSTFVHDNLEEVVKGLPDIYDIFKKPHLQFSCAEVNIKTFILAGINKVMNFSMYSEIDRDDKFTYIFGIKNMEKVHIKVPAAKIKHIDQITNARYNQSHY